MWWTSIAVFLSKRTPPGSARTPGCTRAPELAAQEGLTLIEVLISSMLVALIAVGTLTGFATAGKTTAEAGTHSQATVCAQQDEERLRGMNSEALANLGSQTSTEAENCQCVESVSGAWRYCPSSNLAGESYKGTVFTLSTSVTPHTESSSGAAETCTVESGTISYLRTTTQVKWSGLGERHAVSQSSIVTTPLAAALEIKVHTENLEPVSGAEVTMTSNGTNFTQTTGSLGCVIFGYVNSNSVEVKVQKTGWVEPDGNATPSKTISVSADTTTTKEFILNQAGSITAEFEFKGAKVEGDTFVAHHSMGTSTEFDQEGTLGSYTTKVTTPSTLYPFVTLGTPATSSPYLVYAGDCEANNPETVTSKAVVPAKAQVEPGGTTSVKVPVAPIKIEVKSGKSSSSPGSLITSGTATLTNTGCASATPNNYLVSKTTIPAWVHSQSISSGKLVHEYQPFGTFALCVTNGSWRYRTTAANTSSSGVTVPTIYLESGEKTTSSCP
jgi:Tfp pilus assembly protein PilV